MEAAQGISHVGIAVTDLESAIQRYSAILGIHEIERMDVATENVKIALIKFGDTEIELLSPINESGPIAKFIKERGEGIHHLAIRVPNVTKAIEKAKASGFRMIDEVPRRGARGTDAAFVHPKSMNGVLLEFYAR
ncbi:MAG: methylmalonyl-CoA epimerase [Thaumarchaeota archaeon]|nr:methylmalonyl-CoA epimerase [Nitrososphaerota archaeon]